MVVYFSDLSAVFVLLRVKVILILPQNCRVRQVVNEKNREPLEMLYGITEKIVTARENLSLRQCKIDLSFLTGCVIMEQYT